MLSTTDIRSMSCFQLLQRKQSKRDFKSVKYWSIIAFRTSLITLLCSFRPVISVAGRRSKNSNMHVLFSPVLLLLQRTAFRYSHFKLAFIAFFFFTYPEHSISMLSKDNIMVAGSDGQLAQRSKLKCLLALVKTVPQRDAHTDVTKCTNFKYYANNVAVPSGLNCLFFFCV